MLKRFALLSFLLCLPLAAQTGTSKAELEVRGALANFIQAFDNLDWDRFRMAFSDDATVFYPRGIPERAKGRAEFERNFRIVFAQIRGARTTAPYMDLQPRSLEVQMLGDVAIATFHLDDRAGFVNRRTIVLRKTESGWKIVHLHASEVATTTAASEEPRSR